jgi:hypothetical protein
MLQEIAKAARDEERDAAAFAQSSGGALVARGLLRVVAMRRADSVEANLKGKSRPVELIAVWKAPS